jgi:hypothetical protein
MKSNGLFASSLQRMRKSSRSSILQAVKVLVLSCYLEIVQPTGFLLLPE